MRKQIDQLGQCDEAHTTQAEFRLDLLHGRARAPAAFLSIHREQYRHGLGAGVADQFDRLPDRRAGRDDIVDNHDPAGKRPAHHASALAMRLGFLAIEGPGNAPVMMFGERYRRAGDQRDALVGGAEQHDVADARALQGSCVALAEDADGFAVVEQAGVEEIRTFAARFQGEAPEAQGRARQREVDEAALVILHGGYHNPVRIITLNANGIRSAASKGAFEWLRGQDADVVCLQETRARESQLDGYDVDLPGYHRFFQDAERPGYSGVAIYSRREPDRVVRGFGVDEFDREGRYLEAGFGDLAVVSLYLPSGSASPERQASKFRFLDAFMPHLRQLQGRGGDVVLCGDWNIAHRAIDLRNWKGNQKNSGFLPEERSWMDRLLGEEGYSDAFRQVSQEPDQYTWWSNRGQAWAKNVGWRIDYQIVSAGLAAAARGVHIHKASRFSDHAPLVIDYDRPL